MRRFAFIGGLVLGGSVTAFFLGSAFCYLFTGKLPSIEVGADQRPRLSLVDVGALYERPAVIAAPRAWPTDKEAV